MEYVPAKGDSFQVDPLRVFKPSTAAMITVRVIVDVVRWMVRVFWMITFPAAGPALLSFDVLDVITHSLSVLSQNSVLHPVKVAGILTPTEVFNSPIRVM